MGRLCGLAAWFLVFPVALAVTPAALAGGPALRIGAAEDAVKQTSLVDAKTQLDLLKLAGLDTVRISSTWAPGQTAPSADDSLLLTNAVAGAALDGLKVYVSVSQFGSATTPLSDADQQAFAQYTASIAAAYPALAGIIVGNEPNINRFWLPQFNADGTDAAAPAYETLLARTYDAVKAAQPRMQVVGGAVSPHGGDKPGGARPTHSPTLFVEDLGAAYRASGRTTPIMDAFGIHPYGDSSSQAPTVTHASTSIGVGDYGKLVTLLGQAFDGTAQPGSTLPILYDEYGVESQIPAAQSSLYTGTEPASTKPVDEATQGAYYRSAVQLAFCQPNVIGLLLFHAVDEDSLDRWQSGLYYADGTPKSSLPVVRTAAQESRRGVVARCDGLLLTPRLRYLYWPRGAPLKAGRVRVLITCDIDCRYVARIGRQVVSRKAVGRVRTTIAFPKLVPKGTYRIRLTLTAPVNPGPPLVVVSRPVRITGRS
jgi:hypothetical protein